MKQKERLDKLLVDRGLVKSRERARSLIMQGRVNVDGTAALKAGTLVDEMADIELKGQDIPYVGRGGVKLAYALDFFRTDPLGLVAMDIGCSTGGFSDCLLKRGAGRVYAIDVGYGQFDWSLRNDPRVVLMEKTNIRFLERSAVAEPVDLAVIDVSFISLLKVLPKAAEFLRAEGRVIALIKPQFEAGRAMVGKGGVVRDEEIRAMTVRNIRTGSELIGFRDMGVCESPIPGQKGNIEYFICLERK